MDRQRRGETASERIGGMAITAAIVIGLIWFFNKDKGDGPLKLPGGVEVRTKKERPDPVVDARQMDRPLFGDDIYELTVRNVGGAGKIRVEVEVSRDKAGREVLTSKSTVVYLEKGEEKRLRFNLGNVGTGTVWHSARARAID